MKFRFVGEAFALANAKSRIFCIERQDNTGFRRIFNQHHEIKYNTNNWATNIRTRVANGKTAA